ncbi:phospholipase [Dysgonomonas sp. 520]|nr:phospholipase [Dysgonomonas sp. 520]
MKTCFLFTLIFLFSSIHTYGQEHLSNDSITHKEHPKDSLNRSELIKLKAEKVLGDVFRPDSTLNARNILKEFDNSPSFGIYKNNYIIAGTTMSGRVSKFNSDAKIQISVSQRLTNSVLPFNSYLFLTFTQLAYWDIFRESFPFRDLNFNPTIGLGRALAYKNRFLGVLSFQLEHESNGKDEDYSRSWNKISFMGLLKINRHWTVQAKAWIPLVDGGNNKDIVKYKGWGHLGIDYSKGRRFNVGLLLTKRSTSDLSANITMNLSYRFSTNTNQYLFVEYFNGYGESLIDYNKYHHRIRAGIVIKPNFLFVY